VQRRPPEQLRERQREAQLPRQPTRPADQAADVAALEPEPAEPVLRAVGRDRLRQADPVDAAGRGAGDDVDDDPRPDAVLGRRLEQVGIDPLGRGRPGRVMAFGEQRRRLDEPVDLLRLAVHVDRQRDAAVADHGEAQLPRARVCRSNDASLP
jgi:hypothetical protein